MVTDPNQQGVPEAVNQSRNQSADGRMSGAPGHFSFSFSKSLFHSFVKENSNLMKEKRKQNDVPRI